MPMDKEKEEMIERLYREMFPRLYIYAVNALNDDHIAEEAVQDTFRIACMKAVELQHSKNQQGWLMLTLKNVIRNIRRAQTRMANLLVTIFSENDTVVCNANHELEFSALYSDLVGAEDFDLLVKIAVEGDTIADVAAELGITVEACKKRVQRAKARLKKALEKITDQQSP